MGWEWKNKACPHPAQLSSSPFQVCSSSTIFQLGLPSLHLSPSQRAVCTGKRNFILSQRPCLVCRRRTPHSFPFPFTLSLEYFVCTTKVLKVIFNTHLERFSPDPPSPGVSWIPKWPWGRHFYHRDFLTWVWTTVFSRGKESESRGWQIEHALEKWSGQEWAVHTEVGQGVVTALQLSGFSSLVLSSVLKVPWTLQLDIFP